MLNMSRFLAVFHARNKEFWRDKAALGWNLAFPMLLILGFSVIFSDKGQSELTIGLIQENKDATAFFQQIKHIDTVNYSDKEAGLNKLTHHKIDLLVDWNNAQYWVNTHSPQSYIAERMLLSFPHSLKKQSIESDAVGYIEWFLPGILSMNIMFSCLFGVGYVIVRYRKNGVLKRLKATPIKATEFIAAQITSRLLIVLSVTVFVFTACWWILELTIIGSLLNLFIITTLGALSLIALGLLIATRSESEEFTGGMLNFASWPMMFLSGVWFSLETTPKFIQLISQFLPLTHLIEASRKIMNDGAQLMDIKYHIVILLIMTLIFFMLSAFLFRWGESR